MASTKAMLPFIAAENSVAAKLQILSERLAEDLSPREFVALAFARFSVGDRVVEIANAGLPDPYLISSEGAVTALEVPGGRLPLGARRGIVYESRSWQLDEGDRLLMFSDGLPEARVDGSPLGYEGLAALLPRTDQAASSWIETLFGAVKGQTEEERPTIGRRWCSTFTGFEAEPSGSSTFDTPA